MLCERGFCLARGGRGLGHVDSCGLAASGAIGVDYSFYDTNRNNMSLHTTGSFTESTDKANFALYANQPCGNRTAWRYQERSKLRLHRHGFGLRLASFYCPDAATCNDVLPQLIYGGQLLVPMADLIEQCQMACNELIDVVEARHDPSRIVIVGAAGGRATVFISQRCRRRLQALDQCVWICKERSISCTRLQSN